MGASILFNSSVDQDGRVRFHELDEELPKDSSWLGNFLIPGDPRVMLIELSPKRRHRDSASADLQAFLEQQRSEKLFQAEGVCVEIHLLSGRILPYHGFQVVRAAHAHNLRHFVPGPHQLGCMPASTDAVSVSLSEGPARRYAYERNVDVSHLAGCLAGWLGGETPNLDVTQAMEQLLIGEPIVRLVLPQSFAS